MALPTVRRQALPCRAARRCLGAAMPGHDGGWHASPRLRTARACRREALERHAVREQHPVVAAERPPLSQVVTSTSRRRLKRVGTSARGRRRFCCGRAREGDAVGARTVLASAVARRSAARGRRSRPVRRSLRRARKRGSPIAHMGRRRRSRCPSCAHLGEEKRAQTVRLALGAARRRRSRPDCRWRRAHQLAGGVLDELAESRGRNARRMNSGKRASVRRHTGSHVALTTRRRAAGAPTARGRGLADPELHGHGVDERWNFSLSDRVTLHRCRRAHHAGMSRQATIPPRHTQPRHNWASSVTRSPAAA